MASTLLERARSADGPAARVAAAIPKKRRRLRSVVPDIGFPPGSADGALLRVQRRERGPQLAREELRLLPRREMPALVYLVEVDQVLVGAAGPGLRRTVDVLGKDRDGHRKRDLGRLPQRRTRGIASPVLPVEPRGRGRAVG